MNPTTVLFAEGLYSLSMAVQLEGYWIRNPKTGLVSSRILALVIVFVKFVDGGIVLVVLLSEIHRPVCCADKFKYTKALLLSCSISALLHPEWVTLSFGAESVKSSG